MSRKVKEGPADSPQKVSAAGKISGFPLLMDGVVHIVPPLNIRGVEEREDDIEKVQTDRTLSPLAKFDLLCKIILQALQRNYPTMKMEFVKEWVDLENVTPTFHAVMSSSGYAEAREQVGETVRAGSTGTTSKPASQPQQDGNSST